jgi:hypothetical protein
VEPQVRPAGILAAFSIERYGLGDELVGTAVWEWTAPAEIASTAKAAKPSDRRLACVFDIMASPRVFC